MRTAVQIVAILVYLAIMAGATLGMLWLQGQMGPWSYLLLSLAGVGGIIFIAHLIDRRRDARDRAFGLRGGQEDQDPPRGR
ncbi:hypothetical protein CHELA1G11_12975 [Hyphomicrobiales bacterium]|nr:hypothetical protein CHELA1G2_11335 [Hyphomicrobiales bacterium]CAH1668432.1 hypothetical protein CHELA1G11_12975 [Hyphomicrobiales bacterium]